jgi:DNA-directed RNA polymerase specialized sigma24 family protein
MRDDNDAVGGGEVQQEALARLDRAVAEFKTVEALQALYDSNVLAGLRERLHIRWPCLRNEHDMHHVISTGVDALADELENRRRVTDPVGFVWRIIERRANDEVRRRRRETSTDPQVMAGKVIPVLPADIGPALQEARRLLPRIRGDKVRGAMEIILNAMEGGRQLLPSSEIGEALGVSEEYARQLRVRAFDRLGRLAREEQAAGRGFQLPELWDNEEELLVAPDGGDEDDED